MLVKNILQKEAENGPSLLAETATIKSPIPHPTKEISAKNIASTNLF